MLARDTIHTQNIITGRRRIKSTDIKQTHTTRDEGGWIGRGEDNNSPPTFVRQIYDGRLMMPLTSSLCRLHCVCVCSTVDNFSRTHSHSIPLWFQFNHNESTHSANHWLHSLSERCFNVRLLLPTGGWFCVWIWKQIESAVVQLIHFHLANPRYHTHTADAARLCPRLLSSLCVVVCGCHHDCRRRTFEHQRNLTRWNHNAQVKDIH